MDFLHQPSIWIYLFIFFGKILEVTVATVRLVLINRGERLKGAVIAFFEVILWLVVTGTVLVGFQQDIWRCVVFALAFALGNYLGSWLESKLAFGLCSIQVIVSQDNVAHENTAQTLAQTLRHENFAVTILEGKGKLGKRDILLLHLKRKRIPRAVSIIKENLENAVITVNDVKVIRGGYIKK